MEEGVKIVLDKERILKINLNTMVRFESVVGKGNFDSSFEHVRAMIWASLCDEDTDITLDYVGSIIPLKRLPEVAEALKTVFEIDPLVEESPG